MRQLFFKLFSQGVTTTYTISKKCLHSEDIEKEAESFLPLQETETYLQMASVLKIQFQSLETVTIYYVMIWSQLENTEI